MQAAASSVDVSIYVPLPRVMYSPACLPTVEGNADINMVKPEYVISISITMQKVALTAVASKTGNPLTTDPQADPLPEKAGRRQRGKEG